MSIEKITRHLALQIGGLAQEIEFLRRTIDEFMRDNGVTEAEAIFALYAEISHDPLVNFTETPVDMQATDGKLVGVPTTSLKVHGRELSIVGDSVWFGSNCLWHCDASDVGILDEQLYDFSKGCIRAIELVSGDIALDIKTNQLLRRYIIKDGQFIRQYVSQSIDPAYDTDFPTLVQSLSVKGVPFYSIFTPSRIADVLGDENIVLPDIKVWEVIDRLEDDDDLRDAVYSAIIKHGKECQTRQ